MKNAKTRLFVADPGEALQAEYLYWVGCAPSFDDRSRKVARAFAQEPSLKEIGDPKTCEYWRYCALGGTLCACCGGTHKSCPPGAEASPITWVGTCRNPVCTGFSLRSISTRP